MYILVTSRWSVLVNCIGCYIASLLLSKDCQETHLDTTLCPQHYYVNGWLFWCSHEDNEKDNLATCTCCLEHMSWWGTYQIKVEEWKWPGWHNIPYTFTHGFWAQPPLDIINSICMHMWKYFTHSTRGHLYTKIMSLHACMHISL